ncbi:YetF domain-containing protein [Microbacterium oleivorans]|uniref:DUF421 domain-containing protein n=1 Tax=Microbacterium TaxID=33882 RepID=UPI0034093418
MWFDDWPGVARVLLVGLASYVSVVALIRLAGKRALAQLNAFDLVVTVALGSTLATILLSSDVAFVDGAVALALLLTLQVIVAFATKRVPALRRMVTAKPAQLVKDGVIDDEALQRHRVARADVLQAIRSSGQGDLASVGAVTLESNGTISVIPCANMGNASALGDVEPSFGNGALRDRGRSGAED